MFNQKVLQILKRCYVCGLWNKALQIQFQLLVEYGLYTVNE